MARTNLKKLGARIKEEKEFEEEVIEIARVTRVVKGGRRLRFRACVVVGDRKGRVGMGLGKAAEVAKAIEKATKKAKKNIIIVPLRNDTIPHQVKFKFKSVKLIIIPAMPGTGIVAGGPSRKVLELAGVKNVLGKSFGSTNKICSTYAIIKALQELRK